MANITKNIVCVLPDGREFPHEIHFLSGDSKNYINGLYQDAAERSVRQAGLSCSYKDIQKVQVEIFVLSIKGVELVRTRLETRIITLPVRQLTDDEFNKEHSSLLDKLPEEFRGFVSGLAWEQGHSSGYKEVLMIVEELVDNLKLCIDNYLAKITRKR